MLDQFSATIEKVYAAAADASLWQEALRAIEDYTGSTGAVLNLVPKCDAVAPVAIAGSFSADDCADYALNYMWRCPRIAFAAAHPETPIHYDGMILSESEMDRDATYEWYGSHGLRYYVAGWMGESSTHRAYMSLQRSRRQGHIEPVQVEQFALLLRHMTQAHALAVKLGTLDQQCQVSLGLLDTLHHAVFALDPEGKVLLTNARADAMTSAGDGLFVSNGRLHCQLSSQQAQLDALVGAAVASEPNEARGGSLRIHRMSGQRPYVALVSPFIRSEVLFSSCKPIVLVIVGDPADPAVPRHQALRQLYGLTQAEARVASALSGGHSVESAAALLHMQLGTARTHLKAVFHKLGVNRQQDLVRLLTSLSMIAPPG